MRLPKKAALSAVVMAMAFNATILSPLHTSPASANAIAPKHKILSAGDHVESLTWGGLTRTFLVHVPSGRALAGRPLVVVFHGAGNTASSTADSTDFEQVANRLGDDVVFAQGYHNTWDDLVGNTASARAHVNDIGFANALLNALTPLIEYNVSRVALTGFSNGALMVETLGCRLAGRINLIVPVEGELGSAVGATCKPSRPINVLEIHSTADTTIPYSGGTYYATGGSVSVLSAPASAARWAELDGCNATPVMTTGAGLRFTHYSGCRNGVTVRLRTIVGGSHSWGSNIGQLVMSTLGH